MRFSSVIPNIWKKKNHFKTGTLINNKVLDIKPFYEEQWKWLPRLLIALALTCGFTHCVKVMLETLSCMQSFKGAWQGDQRYRTRICKMTMKRSFWSHSSHVLMNCHCHWIDFLILALKENDLHCINVRDWGSAKCCSFTFPTSRWLACTSLLKIKFSKFRHPACSNQQWTDAICQIRSPICAWIFFVCAT